MCDFYDDSMDNLFDKSPIELVEEIHAKMMTLPTKRPLFGPTQVRSMDEIQEGDVVIRHHTNIDYSQDIRILSIDRENETYTYTPTDPKYTFTGDGFFADAGVTPYRSRGIQGEDVWNTSNWMEKKT